MKDPASKTSDSPRRLLGPVFVVLAVLTCPCHLPIWGALLAGTAAGALLSERLDIAVAVLTLLFLGFVAGAWRTLRTRIKPGAR